MQGDSETPESPKSHAPNGVDTDGSATSPAGATDEKSYWLDQPGNVRKIYIGLWVISFLLVAADALYEKHPHFAIEGWPGFFGFYGFISCVSLVLAAKVLRKFVMRPEDYYDK